MAEFIERARRSSNSAVTGPASAAATAAGPGRPFLFQTWLSREQLPDKIFLQAAKCVVRGPFHRPRCHDHDHHPHPTTNPHWNPFPQMLFSSGADELDFFLCPFCDLQLKLSHTDTHQHRAPAGDSCAFSLHLVPPFFSLLGTRPDFSI